MGGGLKPELTDDQIKAHFEQYGAILEFEMPFDKTKDARKGFGFITFEKEETMKDLIKKGKPRADNFFGQQGGGGGDWGGNYGYDYSWAGGYGGGDMYGGGGWGQQPMGYGGWGPYGGGGARGGGKMQRGRGRGRGRGGPY